MEEANSERAFVIQHASTLTLALYEALESQDVERIQDAQQNLTVAAEFIWAQLNSATNISNQDKAIVRLLAGGAIKELPQLIQDPANYAKIKRELRLLKSSITLLP